MYQLVIDGADVRVHYLSDRGEIGEVAERVASAFAALGLDAAGVTARLVRSIPTGRGEKMELVKMLRPPLSSPLQQSSTPS